MIRRGSGGEVAVRRGEQPRVFGAVLPRPARGARALRAHRYDSEVPRMNRQNLFSGVWDGDNEELGFRHRIFWRPDDARMGATQYELAPGATGMRMHMHFGAEEMFFVLSGRPVWRNQHGEEELAPGDFVFCPEGRAGLHAFSNPDRGTRSDPRDQRRELPGRRRLPRTRIRMGGDSRSRPRATRARRRPRHHRSLRDPDRVIARPYRHRQSRRGRASGLFAYRTRVRLRSR